MKKSKEIVTFISENLDKLKEEYKAYSNEDFYGTSVEDWKVISIIGEKDLATYIDFNDDNGYMVVGNEFQLYDFKVSGDKEYLKDVNVPIFSKQSGFVRFDENEKMLKAYEKQEVDSVASPCYNGQIGNYEGRIQDPDAYIKSRYDDGYTLEREYDLRDYNHVMKHDLSIFKYNDTTWEPNDNLAAVYAIVNSWAESGVCPNFLDHYNLQGYVPEMDPNYQSMLNSGWNLNKDKIQNRFWGYLERTVHEQIPVMYMQMRHFLVHNKNYYPSNGCSLDDALYGMSCLAGKFNQKLNDKTYPDTYDYALQFMNNNNGAQLLILEGSSQYGNACFPIYGYKIYSKKTGWWIFSSEKQVILVKMDDMESYKYYADGYNENTKTENNVYYYDLQANEKSTRKILCYDTLNM